MTKAKSLVCLLSEKVVRYFPLDHERYELVHLLECRAGLEVNSDLQLDLLEADSRVQLIYFDVLDRIALATFAFVDSFDLSRVDSGLSLDVGRVMRSFDEYEGDWKSPFDFTSFNAVTDALVLFLYRSLTWDLPDKLRLVQ